MKVVCTIQAIVGVLFVGINLALDQPKVAILYGVYGLIGALLAIAWSEK